MIAAQNITLRADHESLGALIGAANRISLTHPGSAFAFAPAPEPARMGVQAGLRVARPTVAAMALRWRHTAAVAGVWAGALLALSIVAGLAVDAAGWLV
jgi:hypothetical protein